MDFDDVINMLNKILIDKDPISFNSAWILKHAPQCYRFIRQNIRTESGRIDWDRITCALQRKYQRRWFPKRNAKVVTFYENSSEVYAIIEKYRDKLYVFLAPSDQNDLKLRDMISISLVRLAQNGNILAKREALKLVQYTVDDWIDKYRFMWRWRGYEDYFPIQIEGCIRRYRYSGSFLHYLFRTLQCAGRGLKPIYTFSLDRPIASDSDKCWHEKVYKDFETNEIRLHDRTDRFLW